MDFNLYIYKSKIAKSKIAKSKKKLNQNLWILIYIYINQK